MTTVKNLKLLATTCVLVAAGLCCMSFQAAAEEPDSSESYLRASPEDIQWWRDLAFGMFIHWDPSSLLGVEISWERGKRPGAGGGGRTPVEVYDNLYRSFYPAQFNAQEWADIAKAAGMKYMVFTSKHHDGFCMFHTALTDYKISNTPFKRDIVKEVADACRAAGLKFGFYYSQPDWHHPDYLRDNHDRYIEYLHGQLRELCTNYGRIDMIFFDGLGGASKSWDAPRLFKMIRELQPHVIINNRAGISGDYDTPEQRIGGFQNDRPWETCMTIGTQWAWKVHDNIKSRKQCIQTLVNVVGGDGNLLFNVGPMPTGLIEPRQAERLREMGEWLEKYGESVYATRGGPFKPGSWGASTHKGNTIYVHVMDWRDMPRRLPAIDERIVASELLTGGTVRVIQDAKGIAVDVPSEHRQDIDTIIKLTLDGPAGEIAARIVPSGSLAAHKPARASSSRKGDQYSADKAFDDDVSTHWCAGAGSKQAWLEVDLGENRSFNRVRIREGGTPWVEKIVKFEVQYQKRGRWHTVLEGGKIGEGGRYEKEFKPVTARKVRLNITEAKRTPRIFEFQILAAE